MKGSSCALVICPLTILDPTNRWPQLLLICDSIGYSSKFLWSRSSSSLSSPFTTTSLEGFPVGLLSGRGQQTPKTFSGTIKSVTRPQAQMKLGKPHVATRFSVELAGVERAHRPLLCGAERGELGLPVAVIDSLANPLSKERWHS